VNLHLTDVTLRDGLQSEASAVPTEKKFQLYQKLLECGYSRLEITSFVPPKWIPQLKDSEALCQKIFASPPKEIELMAFVPNEKGMERLLGFPIPWASVFIATTETFNQKNVNQSVADTLKAIAGILAKAKTNQRKVRVYVSTMFGCPYEGPISVAQSEPLLRQLAALAPDEIALSDTIGVALPDEVEKVLDSFFKVYPKEQTALHLHNTYGLALASAFRAYQKGIRRFDGSTGGIGGCPYAKGATGNLATDELSYAFFRAGFQKKFSWGPLSETLRFLAQDLQLKVHSQLFEIFSKGASLYGID
jgi:hydroxymethylglutaryl-CoA lyase